MNEGDKRRGNDSVKLPSVFCRLFVQEASGGVGAGVYSSRCTTSGRTMFSGNLEPWCEGLRPVCSYCCCEACRVAEQVLLDLGRWCSGVRQRRPTASRSSQAVD